VITEQLATATKSLLMDSMIALLLIPFTLSRQKMVGKLWLEASAMDKLATVGPMCLI